MRNIVILTEYHEDTIHAMEMVCRNPINEGVKIVLLSLSHLPDSMPQLLFLSNGDDLIQNREERLLNEWELRKSLKDISIEVVRHHQYGASTPIIKQIIEQYSINSIIIPFSIHKSENDVYKDALQSFKNVKCEIILMPARETSFSID